MASPELRLTLGRHRSDEAGPVASRQHQRAGARALRVTHAGDIADSRHRNLDALVHGVVVRETALAPLREPGLHEVTSLPES